MKAQLKVRTEYSFRTVYGPVDKVTERLKMLGCHSAAITDRSSTFGHVAWQTECKKQGIKPIFGVELAFIEDVTVKERRQNLQWHTLLARNESGLRELYATVEEATRNFHYVPRLPLAQLDCFSQDLIVLSGGGDRAEAGSPKGNRFTQLHPALNTQLVPGISVPVSDNYLIETSNKPVYEILAGRNALMRPAPIHILDQYELMAELDLDDDQPFLLAEHLAQECNVSLPQAQNVRYPSNKTLMELCLEGAKKRGLELNDVYMARLEREIKMIYEKEFSDYFYLVMDLINYAKTVMLVGPARGSSCGSLACYLLGITDIDPLPHNLIFERFIDVTRRDLPDIDIDFQDDKREMVFDYLTEKYGADCVARLGTISKYKAKSAIGEAAKALDIPPWETTELKRSIIERLSGDSRSAFCIADTFQDIDAGKKFISKYPAMRICEKLEGHARHSGMHAAGVVITEKPLNHYVARDVRTNTVHIDKYDAVAVNLLKIDALGLRTLSVIEDCLKQIGWNNDALLALPLDDDKAFEVLRKNMYCGIFQFEGSAQQSVARRFPIDRFTDIIALTALSRPGPFASGATNEWVLRRTGQRQPDYLHSLTEDITKDTYGLIVYQEDVMRIAREVGGLSWEDVSELRKAMSRSLGIEYFDKFWERFRIGALEKPGIDEVLARKIWDQINTMGSMTFNKSHVVAYGYISYYCCYLKAHYPLQFALATLRHNRDSVTVIRYLRELDRCGQRFVAFHPELSERDWSIKDGMLVGGLLNVKGVGRKTAEDILYRRENEEPLTAGQVKKLAEAVTPFDNIFEARTKFPKLLARPKEFGIVSPITELIDVDETGGRFVVLAKIVDKNLRSLNENMFLVKRNGMKVPNDLWLNLIIEDDTTQIPVTISRYDYQRLGKPIAMQYKIGDWFIWKGFVKPGQRRLFVERYKYLEAEAGSPAREGAG